MYDFTFPKNYTWILVCTWALLETLNIFLLYSAFSSEPAHGRFIVSRKKCFQYLTMGPSMLWFFATCCSRLATYLVRGIKMSNSGLANLEISKSPPAAEVAGGKKFHPWCSNLYKEVYEFIRCFHQFFPPILTTFFSVEKEIITNIR